MRMKMYATCVYGNTRIKIIQELFEVLNDFDRLFCFFRKRVERKDGENNFSNSHRRWLLGAFCIVYARKYRSYHPVDGRKLFCYPMRPSCWDKEVFIDGRRGKIQ